MSAQRKVIAGLSRDEQSFIDRVSAILRERGEQPTEAAVHRAIRDLNGEPGGRVARAISLGIASAEASS
jgi:N-formylglutamate amidohydrolase